MSLMDFALNLISQNPYVANNPNCASMINVIKSGDSQTGELIARNICESYGLTQEQATMQARNFFHI